MLTRSRSAALAKRHALRRVLFFGWQPLPGLGAPPVAAVPKLCTRAFRSHEVRLPTMFLTTTCSALTGTTTYISEARAKNGPGALSGTYVAMGAGWSAC